MKKFYEDMVANFKLKPEAWVMYDRSHSILSRYQHQASNENYNYIPIETFQEVVYGAEEYWIKCYGMEERYDIQYDYEWQ